MEVPQNYSEVSDEQMQALELACRHIFPTPLAAMHGCMLISVRLSNSCVMDSTPPADQLNDLKNALGQMFEQEKSVIN